MENHEIEPGLMVSSGETLEAIYRGEINSQISTAKEPPPKAATKDIKKVLDKLDRVGVRPMDVEKYYSHGVQDLNIEQVMEMTQIAAEIEKGEKMVSHYFSLDDPGYSEKAEAVPAGVGKGDK